MRIAIVAPLVTAIREPQLGGSQAVVADLAVGAALVVAAALDVLYQRLERMPVPDSAEADAAADGTGFTAAAEPVVARRLAGASGADDGREAGA